MSSITLISRRSVSKPLSEFSLVAAFSVTGLLVSLAVTMMTWPQGIAFIP